MNNLIPAYNRINISFTHGEGAWVFAKNGKKYLDFASGIAVNSLGHSHPKLIKALVAQGQKLWHVSNLYEIPEQAKLAKKLCALTGLDKAFFSNSGAEANEAAIKLARVHTGRKEIISFTGGFHGRTMGALSITDKASAKKGFEPLLPQTKIIEFNDIKSLKKSVSDKTAGIIFEVFQGESGIKKIDKAFLARVFKLRKKYKFLIIVDEVQTGIGRTGRFLASEYFKIKPDILTLAKGLGGGFPIGAILAKEKIARSFEPGSHGSTFGGSPLASTVSLAAISEISKANFLKKIKENSEFLIKNLKNLQKKYPLILEEARGIGFLIGVEISNIKTRDDIVKILRDKHQILTATAGVKTLRILPPLITTKTEIKWFLTKLEEVLKINHSSFDISH